MEETQKIDKRTKEYKARTNIGETTEWCSAYEALRNAGIPLKMINTRFAVKFIGKNETPQTGYYDPSDYTGSIAPTQDKRASMWYTPHGIICEKGKQRMIIPLANVIYSLPL